MNQKGQALVEYVLIIALISVVVIVIVNSLGGYMKDAMTKTSCSMIGQEYVEGAKVGEGHCKGNWFFKSIIFYIKYNS